MPPKPFNPPRPRQSTSTTTSASKPRGRPKGTTTTTTSAQKSASKAKKDPKRTSTSARFSALPSLSPETRRELEGTQDDEEMILSSSEPEPEDDPFALPAEDEEEEEEEEEEEDRKQHIPEDLLNVILHQFFKEEGTRLHKDASVAVGRYMEVFVREGIARACWAGNKGGNGGGLEVEDLEKLAPQLILDF
ncbi:uncharacterized protein LY89DRAFT_714694 [Mollisia scopiformis]|uniref:Centromere protein X n=1 Tax=Mollisia scopiformis TaxID=149040 RepID=A0A194XN57_MOLSC|nr:uncharacterized protein LY89DRAFT_714694 [Mollisia scopiformis]KUJ21603.1 hypothetical protein LY89DRAFT_714694 [Mollisia scopiformis]